VEEGVKNKTKNVWDWVKEINTLKSSPNSFSDEDWDKNFNAYVIHRSISMNPEFIEIANMAQEFPPQSKKEIYCFYKEFIPKNYKWSKFVKSTKKQPEKELLEYLKMYFKVSLRETKDYLEYLDKETIEEILASQGLDKKEIKKLLK